MECPACNGAMETIDYEGVDIDQCVDCQAVWLDHSEIEPILASRDQKFSPEAARKRVGTTHGGAITKEFRQCPKCGNGLKPFNFAYNSGVMVDRCAKKCGLFFDPGELEKLQVVMERMSRAFGDGEVVYNSRPADPGKGRMCPRDGSPLEMIQYEGESVDQCPTCDGVWCDGAELLRIVRQKQVSPRGTAGDERTRDLKKQGQWKEELFCLVCQAMLESFNYDYTSGIELDRCPNGHGLWLDGSEIDRVQSFAEDWEKREGELAEKFGSQLQGMARDHGKWSKEKAAEAKVRSREAVQEIRGTPPPEKIGGLRGFLANFFSPKDYTKN